MFFLIVQTNIPCRNSDGKMVDLSGNAATQTAPKKLINTYQYAYSEPQELVPSTLHVPCTQLRQSVHPGPIQSLLHTLGSRCVLRWRQWHIGGRVRSWCTLDLHPVDWPAPCSMLLLADELFIVSLIKRACASLPRWGRWRIWGWMPAHGGHSVCVEVVLLSPYLKSGGGITLVFDKVVWSTLLVRHLYIIPFSTFSFKWKSPGDTSNYMIH